MYPYVLLGPLLGNNNSSLGKLACFQTRVILNHFSRLIGDVECQDNELISSFQVPELICSL